MSCINETKHISELFSAVNLVTFSTVQDTGGNLDAKEARDDLRPQLATIFNHILGNIQGSEVRHWVSDMADGKCVSPHQLRLQETVSERLSEHLKLGNDR